MQLCSGPARSAPTNLHRACHDSPGPSLPSHTCISLLSFELSVLKVYSHTLFIPPPLALPRRPGKGNPGLSGHITSKDGQRRMASILRKQGKIHTSSSEEPPRVNPVMGYNQVKMSRTRKRTASEGVPLLTPGKDSVSIQDTQWGEEDARMGMGDLEEGQGPQGWPAPCPDGQGRVEWER